MLKFTQPNIVFDIDRLDSWLKQLDKRNVLDKVYIPISIAPLKSFIVAEYLQTKVPGVNLQDSLLSRMERACEGALEEGAQIALKLIESVKKGGGKWHSHNVLGMGISSPENCN